MSQQKTEDSQDSARRIEQIRQQRWEAHVWSPLGTISLEGAHSLPCGDGTLQIAIRRAVQAGATFP